MNKQVLISIRPEHAVNILNGKKTIELRKVVLKWVLEEIKKGNTVIFNVYVTKGKKDVLHKYKDKYYTNHYLTFTDDVEALNSKVVASFEVSKIENVYFNLSHWRFEANANGIDLTVDSCVTQTEIEKYFRLFSGSGKNYGYALHISNLKVFDKPKELSEYYTFKKKTVYSGMDCPPYVDEVKVNVKKAPQNMMTVWGE